MADRGGLKLLGFIFASVTLAVTVVGAGNGAPAPAGNVTFYNNGNKIQPATLDGTGKISITPTSFFYSSTGNNSASRSPSGISVRSSISTATGAISAEYVTIQMCAAVATDAATPEAAAAEAEQRCKRYFRRQNR